jgi:RHH-type proline utilization regulon transcriptional repressor/proline dehydrogenase/delta 1-pyrroline-5-carboxylate dehydrogenase
MPASDVFAPGADVAIREADAPGPGLEGARSTASYAMSALFDRCLGEIADDADRSMLRASAASYALAWHDHFGREHLLAALLGERNTLRYRRCRRVLVRGETASAPGRLALCQVLLAAHTCGVPLSLSLSAGEVWPWLADQDGVAALAEGEAELIARLRSSGAARLRAVAPVSLAVRAAAHEAGAAVIDAPAVAAGRLELRWYLREQALSRVLHRYGNVIGPARAV